MASNFFLKKYWNVVGDDIQYLVQAAFINGCFDKDLTDTLIVLIPKEERPTNLKQFHPISLCNVVYKPTTKVLVNKPRPYLNYLIGPLQSSFIPGRSSTDNVVVAQEVMHYMHHSKSKRGTLTAKIDIEKAYNRVNWDFLQST